MLWVMNYLKGYCVDYHYSYDYPALQAHKIYRVKDKPNEVTINENKALPLTPAQFSLAVLPKEVHILSIHFLIQQGKTIYSTRAPTIDGS